MARAERAAIATLAFGVTLAIGLEASARTETLRWTHPDPASVNGFMVHWGDTSRTYTYDEDAGMPTPVDGVFSWDIEVDDTAEVWVAVTAYDDALASFFSNEQCRGPSGACGSDGGGTDTGAGDPGDGGTTPSGAIQGFRLWDASSSGDDTLIDSDFQSGESIDLGVQDCVAIEVMVNGYLATSGGPGSVAFSFDDSGGSCVSAGTDFENEPPFAWETDAGDKRFSCAPSLTEPGTHRLIVTPYDGDDCTGAVGEAKMLTFGVVEASSGDGSTQTLTAPGQPFLVSP